MLKTLILNFVRQSERATKQTINVLIDYRTNEVLLNGTTAPDIDGLAGQLKDWISANMSEVVKVNFVKIDRDNISIYHEVNGELTKTNL